MKAIVVTGSERAFSGGADVKAFGTPNAAREPRLPALIAAFENSPKPVVAAVAGVCMGGGLESRSARTTAWPRATRRSRCPKSSSACCPAPAARNGCRARSGVEAALNMIVSANQSCRQRKLKGSVVDDVVDGDLVAAAVVLRDKVVADKLPLKRVRDQGERPAGGSLPGVARNTVGAASKQTSRRR